MCSDNRVRLSHRLHLTRRVPRGLGSVCLIDFTLTRRVPRGLGQGMGYCSVSDMRHIQQVPGILGGLSISSVTDRGVYYADPRGPVGGGLPPAWRWSWPVAGRSRLAGALPSLTALCEALWDTGDGSGHAAGWGDKIYRSNPHLFCL